MTLPDTFSSAEVGEKLGHGAAWVEAQARRGKLVGSKVGRSWRFRQEDVERYLLDLRPAPPAPVIHGLAPRSRRRSS